MTAGAPKLRARRSGQLPSALDGRWVLQGEVEWLLGGTPDELDTVAKALDGTAERLSEDLLLLRFGNAVGFFNLPLLGTVEVVSGKWDRTHFERMLSDLMRVASALPFTADVTAALPYDRSVAARQDVLYHAFVYLRHALSRDAPANRQLLPALDLILREPHRRFERTRREVSLDAARRVDARTLEKVAVGHGLPTRVESAALRALPLALALRGHLPDRIEQAEILKSNDTPENRFVKAFLASALGLIDAMRREMRRGSRGGGLKRRVLDDCAWMERALWPVIRHPLWQEVGPMQRLPVASTVLQRRRGYRDVFQHFARLRLAARIPLSMDLVRQLLEVKDIALLYELWCYFAVAEAMQELLGPPISAGRPAPTPTELVVSWELATVWADGTRLVYNPRFSRGGAPGRLSYSVALRPDIALEVPAGPNAGLHLLDAKFRLERLDAVMSVDERDDDSTGEEPERAYATFTRDDLYKMHAYRDAIPRAQSVWILYPGDELRFFSSIGGGVARLPKALPERIEGVGALPLPPVERVPGVLEQVLSNILGRERPVGSPEFTQRLE